MFGIVHALKCAPPWIGALFNPAILIVNEAPIALKASGVHAIATNLDLTLKPSVAVIQANP